MKRRTLLRLTAAVASAGPALLAAGRQPVEWAGYDDALVIDALGGPIQFNIPQQDLPLNQRALAAVRAAGVSGVNITVHRNAGNGLTARAASEARMRAWLAQIDRTPADLMLVRTVEDLHVARIERRLGLIFGFQDATPVAEDADALEAFHALGLRIVQLTYNRANVFGSGCLELRDDGLTVRGHALIEEMDGLGILADLSHCSAQTTRAAIEVARGPVAITHTGCRSVFNHPRNKDDGTLRRLADRGGVAGIYLMPFLNPAGAPQSADVIRHIEHALQVCGEDHVGIGTDQGLTPLDTSGNFPTLFAAAAARREAAGVAAPREDTIPYVPELNGPRRMAVIAGLLESRGHAGRVIEKVLGLNFERLFKATWTPT